jgi:predicted HicB family RNase H-like nuclease
MINTMNIDGQQAVIVFDPEIDMFRGEFVGLNGGADFYSSDVKGLHREGAISLRVFLETCKAKDIDPRKHFSGKFVLRVDPAIHEAAALAAAAHGQSLNQWISEAIKLSTRSGDNLKAA